MNVKIVFVIGVNGVGKSTLLPHIQSQLSGNNFELHDFDERGVPDNADKIWRIRETTHWISVGKMNTQKGVSTVIFGFMKPEEITSSEEKIEIILLDADKETIQQRIKSRYPTDESLTELTRTTGKTVEKFVMDNVYVSSLLRKSCTEAGCAIVNTNNRTPDNIAEEVVRLMLISPF